MGRVAPAVAPSQVPLFLASTEASRNPLETSDFRNAADWIRTSDLRFRREGVSLPERRVPTTQPSRRYRCGSDVGCGGGMSPQSKGEDGLALDESLRLLVALADAFAVPDATTGRREPILYLRYGGGADLQHHAFTSGDWRHVDEEMIEGLASQGLLRLEYSGEHTVQIYVTDDGNRVATEAKRMLQGDPETSARPVDLEWESVARPILEATYEAWKEAGAPANGVLAPAVVKSASRDGEDVLVLRALDLLVDGGYLAREGSISSPHGPLAVSVTARGLQAVGGWPATSAEAATEALLAALDRAIEEADDPEHRTKLERLRDASIDVGSGVLTNVLSRVILTGGL